MTTEWVGGLPYDDEDKRVQARMAVSRLSMCYFVRAYLIDTEKVDADIAELIRKSSDEQLLRLNLRDDLWLDELSLAEITKTFGHFWKIKPAFDSKLLTDVESFLTLLMNEVSYEKRLKEVVANEIAGIKKGLDMRVKVADMRSQGLLPWIRDRSGAESQRKKTASGSLSSSPTSSSSSSSSDEEERQFRRHIRVATFNVNMFYGRSSKAPPSTSPTPISYEEHTACVMRAIRRAVSQGCDVLCAQETHEEWVRLLDPLFSLERYPHRLHRTDQSTASGLSVWSRFPLQLHRTIHPNAVVKGSLFPAMCYTIRPSPNQLFFLYNLHLRPPVHLDGSSSAFSMLDTSTIRLQEIKFILHSAPPTGHPYIMVGDFNENDGMHALSYLTSDPMNMTDALWLSDKPTHWWNLPSKPGRAPYVVKKRLDHIMLSPELTPVVCDVYDEELGKGSDHMLVMADIALPSKEI